ncbi:P-loop containing nucleoside triphosphate hydrolase protein, partial [Sphaerosporella brunnea]
IVAVHGLKGDAFKTWTSKGSTPDKDVLWLRDLLPKDIPTARILTYGYDSDPGKVFESASTNMVLHHATTLVSELHYFRRYPNDKHRPIIFVCHSLGGIVVKRALIYSSTCNISHNPELRSIRVCTSGILFLGTPHMGADLARWGKMAESLVRTVMTKAWIDSNESLVNALGKNSETLQNITDSFVGLAPEFQMAFFWEELGTNLGGLTRDVIVEKTSAVLEMPNAKKAGIHATHTEMCKFATTRAPGWNMVSGVLMEFAAGAPGRVAIKWRQLEDHEYLDISWKMEGLINQRRTPSPRRVQGSPKIGSVLLEGAQQQHLTERKLLEAPPAFFKPNHLQENKFFCGRQKELEKVHRTLSDKSKGIVLISSITGGGKTHLARQYFFSRRSEYSGGVFWVECKDVTTGKFSAEVITKWYCAIADELRLPETTVTTTPEQTVMDVVAWFNKKSDWLLVLDGVDIDHDSQYSTIAGYMPRTDAGSIIMTSINPALAGSARLGSPYPLALDPPSLDEAVAMLAHYSQIPSATPSAEYTDLCRALTCLPLAIHAAASYIKETQSPVADFLKKYQRGPFVERRYLEPFHVVFDRLETGFPQAAALIKLLSFWGRGAGGGVPHLMLWWGVRPLHRSQLVKLIAREANRRPADLDVSISQCLRLGIMERGLETGVEGLGGDSGIDTLRLHPIAKAVCVARMKENKELEKWCNLATDVFCNSFEYLDSRRRRSSLDDDPIRKGQDVEFLLSDYARYLTHGIQIMDSIRRYKLPSSERLMEVHSRVQKLTNPDDVSAKVERVSMFLTSGSSSTSGPDLDSP